MTPRNTTGLFPQMLLDVHEELIGDLFAGGGGASLGIEMSTGRQVDFAINHDEDCVELHKINHPQTRHYRADVFEVDPREVTHGRPVGLLWASPDCCDHSKAKGGKPIRTSRRRALAWVVKRWAGQVQPRVIMLENVEEFVEWGPLIGLAGLFQRDPKRKGRTFRRFVRDLEGLGYVVEWRELRACDYGAPTTRKRLFMIARRDARPTWPTPTHGPGRLPYRTAADCIDWSIPMLSIFATREEAKAWGRAHGRNAPKRPLAEATMRRVARGFKRFVLDAARPFVVTLNHGGGRDHAARGLEEPFRTVTASRDAHALVAPYLVPRYGEREGQEPRVRSVEEPSPAVVPTGNGASLVAAFLAKHYGGHETPGAAVDQPAGAVTTQDHHHLVAAHLSTYYGGPGGDGRGAPLDEPLRTQGTANRHGLVLAFLSKFYGQGTGSDVGTPAPTVTAKDRLGLVTVTVAGALYAVADIAMRMLRARELFRCNSFPDSYIIDRGADGRRFTDGRQVEFVGNSVCPVMAAALVRANCPELRARDEVAA